MDPTTEFCGDALLDRNAPPLSADEFAAQFERFHAAMWLIAVAIVGDRTMADDVLQEAAIVALRRLDQFVAGTNLRAWTARIVRNIALNTLRNENRRQYAMNSVSDAHSESASVDYDRTVERTISGSGDDLGFDRRVAVALEMVGDVARACLLLRTVGELQYSEIAELLEIPQGTAMSNVHRARHDLRERLAGVWAEHSDGGAKGGDG